MAFKRAVKRYNGTAFEFDFSKFPRPRLGFFSFESASRLVSALPHKLCDTHHAYDFNCFDTVIVVAAGRLRTGSRIDDIIGPFLVPHIDTNGLFMVLPAATARDAFTLAYPAWYRETTESFIPKAMCDSRVCLTAALFRCHVLPMSTNETTVSDVLMNALRASWAREGIQFPPNFEVVLCHELNFPQHLFVTVHAGLLFHVKERFIYLEKDGGSGPFVRLDFDSRADLRTWLAAMFKEAEKLGYTHHFVTFNDTHIQRIDVGS